jgi:hypothetical protein
MNAVDVSVGTFPVIIIMTEFGTKKSSDEKTISVPF